MIDWNYLAIMLLGTLITRLCTLHRDSPEERRHPGYQALMFGLHFLLFVPMYAIVSWITHKF